jgi:hypothetical protein
VARIAAPSEILSDAPWLFRLLPHSTRTRIVREHTSPKAGWPMKERFVGRVTPILGCTLDKAEVVDGRVQLTLTSGSGSTVHTADHVIAATGYQTDVRRLTLLSEELRSRIRVQDHVPVLSTSFESSVRGLYFVGASAADTFGPVMRFACGAEWTARRLSASLRNRARLPKPEPAPLERPSL